MEQLILSVIVPCYNEIENIEKCILSIVNQKFSFGKYEILVVDGNSNDGTAEVLRQLSAEHDNIRIIRNNRRITPVALNLGIQAAHGEFITILGAHSEYDADYLHNSLKLFKEHPEISCSGGPIISTGNTPFGQAAAMAMSHPIGVGNAKHRFPDYEGYAEGACFPTFRKSVFQEIGYYDERLVRNQDDELNFRMTKTGGKVYISPSVRSVYMVRNRPSKLFRQYFDYGFWRVAVIFMHKMPVSLRQLVPVLFILSLIALPLFSVAVPEHSLILSLFLPLLYISTLCIFSVPVLLNRGLRLSMLFICSVVILHFAYGLGFLRGLFSKRTRLSLLEFNQVKYADQS